MESFTDGTLINLAANGDRKAIVDVCYIVSKLLSQKLSHHHFSSAIKRVAMGVTPNGAFGWSNEADRRQVKVGAKDLLKDLTIAHTRNDKDLYRYIFDILDRLASGQAPNVAFNWLQRRQGRPKANMNAFRDWDIRETVFILMSGKYSFVDACAIVSEATELLYDQGLSEPAIQKIATGISLQNPPKDFPIYALSHEQNRTFALLTEEAIEQAKETVLKSKA